MLNFVHDRIANLNYTEIAFFLPDRQKSTNLIIRSSEAMRKQLLYYIVGYDVD